MHALTADAVKDLLGLAEQDSASPTADAWMMVSTLATNPCRRNAIGEMLCHWHFARSMDSISNGKEYLLCWGPRQDPHSGCSFPTTCFFICLQLMELLMVAHDAIDMHCISVLACHPR